MNWKYSRDFIDFDYTIQKTIIVCDKRIAAEIIEQINWKINDVTVKILIKKKKTNCSNWKTIVGISDFVVKCRHVRTRFFLLVLCADGNISFFWRRGKYAVIYFLCVLSFVPPSEYRFLAIPKIFTIRRRSNAFNCQPAAIYRCSFFWGTFSH